jgi:hypothetical protein
MVGRTLDWKDELGRWLKPFVDRLGHEARRRMCPLYVSGLIGSAPPVLLREGVVGELTLPPTFIQQRLESGGR